MEFSKKKGQGFALDPPKAEPLETHNKENLRTATADEIAETLSYALRYDGRKRVHQGDAIMARITAERLVLHLEKSGYVLMKRPPMTAPSDTTHQPNAKSSK